LNLISGGVMLSNYLSVLDGWDWKSVDPFYGYAKIPDHMKVEVLENGYEIRIEMPGVRPEELNISMDDDELDIEGPGKHSYRLKFSKSLNRTNYEANLDLGILTLRLYYEAKKMTILKLK
jgi:HSP20 family molecular chaperone IbpA